MRESQVATTLKCRLELAGCDWRRAEWIGRHSCPDFFVLLTPRMSRMWRFPRNPWVETKRPTKDANEAQAREHTRMRDHGEIVLVIHDLETLDRWFPADVIP